MCVVCLQIIRSIGDPTPGPLIVSSFLGDGSRRVYLYLLSPAHGKSAPVWRGSLCSDCAFDCLIYVEVAVDLTEPLSGGAAPFQFGFPPAQPTETDMKVLPGCFIQKAALSLSLFFFLPLSLSLSSSPSISPSRPRSPCEVFHWFQTLQHYLHVEPSPAYSSELFQAKRPSAELVVRGEQTDLIWLTADQISSLRLEYLLL